MDQGQPVVRIEPLDFKVKSVLKNPMQEPYGPVTAMKLSYPSWLWMVFVFPLVVVILGSFVLVEAKVSNVKSYRKT